MTRVLPTPELNVGFSSPEAKAPPWSDVVAVLSSSEMFWLSSLRKNGRPHVTPLPAVWLDDALHFCVGSHEQKAKNLEHDPHCVLTTGTNRLRSGLDVIIEGEARRVRDRTRLERLAALWKSKLDWPFGVGDDGFRDGAGRIGLVFRVEPTKVLAFGKGEAFTQTRFRFGN